VEHEAKHRPGRYLAIQVAGKYYAFANECVREMMPVQELFPPTLFALTSGRQGPELRAVTGVSGLKGFLHTQSHRIPVFDLYARLRGEERQLLLTPQTRIVTVDVHDNRVGFYADRLTDLIQARAHELRRDTIIGHGRPKTILTLERLWTPQELAALA
jgi:hypothetical protein